MGVPGSMRGSIVLTVKCKGTFVTDGGRGASALAAAALSAAVVGHPPSRMHHYIPLDESSAG